MEESESKRVDLTEMGIWGKQVRIEFGDRYEDVWIQTIGDRSEALERGHQAMQCKLLEFRPGSERAEALAEAMMLAPEHDLAELPLEAERPKLESRVRREMPDPIAPRQDRAAGEQDQHFARRLTDHQARCRELAAARSKRVEEMLSARRQELLQLPKQELVELARPRRIDIECWNAFARACDDWVLLRAVRRADDHDRPYFHEIAQIEALHPLVKDELRRAYRDLEPSQGDSLPKPSVSTLASGSTT